MSGIPRRPGILKPPSRLPRRGSAQSRGDDPTPRSDTASVGYSESDVRSQGTAGPLEDVPSFKIGDRVLVSGSKPGEIVYLGETLFAAGEWAGIVLDKPEGKNNGSVASTAYFHCQPLHGIFCKLNKLIKDNREASSRLHDLPTGKPNQQKPILDSGYSTPEFKVGDLVTVSGSKAGIVRYTGETKFAKGYWVGVELDDPLGKNDGQVGGVRYFQCEEKHGLFAPVSKLTKTVLSRPSSRLSVASVSSIPVGTVKGRKSSTPAAGQGGTGLGGTGLGGTGGSGFGSSRRLAGSRESLASVSSVGSGMGGSRRRRLSADLLGDRSPGTRSPGPQPRRLMSLSTPPPTEPVEAELDRLRTLVENADNDKMKLVSLLEEEKQKVEDLQFRLEEENILRGDLSAEVTKGQSEERDREGEMARLQDHVADLERRLEAADLARKVAEAGGRQGGDQEKLVDSMKGDISELNSEILRLKSNRESQDQLVSNKDEAVRSLQGELGSMGVKVGELEGELREAREKQDMVGRERDELVSCMDGLERRNGELNKHSRKQSLVIKEKESRLVEVETSLSQANQSVTQMVASLGEIKADAKKERDHIIAEYEIKLMEQGNKDTEAGDKDAEAGNKVTEGHHTALEMKHKKLETEHKTLETEHTKLETGYHKLETEHQKLETEHQKLETEHQKLETEHQKLETDHKKMETEYKKFETEHQKLETEHQKLEREHQKLEREHQKLETEHKTLETEHKKLETEHQKLETEHQKLETEHQKLETEHQKLETEHKTLETGYHKLEMEHKNIETEYKTRETQNKTLKTDNKKLENDHKMVEAEHKKLEVESDDRIQRLNKENLELRASIECLTAQVQTLTRSLNGALSRQQQNQDDKQLELRIGELTNENNMLIKKREESMKINDEKDLQISNFNSIVNELNTKNQELTEFKVEAVEVGKVSEEVKRTNKELMEVQRQTDVSVKDLELQRDSLLKELANVEADKVDIKLNRDRLVAQVEEFKGKLEKQKETFGKEMRENEGKLDEYLKRMESLEKSRDESSENLREKNYEMSNKIKEFNVQRELWLKKDDLLKSNKNELDLAKKTLGEFRDKFMEIENSKLQLKSQKQKAEQSVKKLKNEAEESKKKFDKEIETYKADISVLTARINDKETISVDPSVQFLNSVIIELQEKNKRLESELHSARDDSYMSPPSKGVTTAPRMFCDICDRFDLHETEDCPTQGSDSEADHSRHGSLPQRPYCGICEMFGHATEDCDDEQTY